jgi:hypothetical protein
MSSTLRVGQFGLQVIALTLSPYLFIFLRKMSILAWPDYGAKLSSLCVDGHIRFHLRIAQMAIVDPVPARQVSEPDLTL